jgi:hypothetical protein
VWRFYGAIGVGVNRVWANKLKIFFKGVGGAVVLVMQWCSGAVVHLHQRMSEKFFLRD